MNEMDPIAAERQHILDIGTPPQVIDLLFAERIARIATERALNDARNAAERASEAKSVAENALIDAERRISRERYVHSIQRSCRNDWLAGIRVLYG